VQEYLHRLASPSDRFGFHITMRLTVLQAAAKGIAGEHKETGR